MLRPDEQERYRRQLMHEGFGIEHQERLRNASVLVAGVGGLGGAAATYLAVAGVGRMRLAHFGSLTRSNMNRQTLMRDDGVGTERVIMARDRIRELNPGVEVEIVNERTSAANMAGLLDGTDLALSARPTFGERRVLNMGCVARRLPMVEAAMNGLEGYLFNVMPGETACLHCVFPDDDPDWQEFGFPVFGAVSGMLGCLMALEAIKLVTGFKQPLMNSMFVFDCAAMGSRRYTVRRDPFCPVCGTREASRPFAQASVG